MEAPAELLACERCALSRSRTRVVVGSGPDEPELLVIGEAPGRTEDEGGLPFIGPSGRLLFTLIEDVMGLTRDRCYVTNVVKCRPPSNRTPTRAEVGACRPWLRWQFEHVSPRAVLTLGLVAGQSVLGFAVPMGAMHGRLVTVAGRPGLGTYHPAAALRNGPSLVEVMRADLATLREAMGA